jgi:hypothetical protein
MRSLSRIPLTGCCIPAAAVFRAAATAATAFVAICAVVTAITPVTAAPVTAAVS